MSLVQISIHAPREGCDSFFSGIGEGIKFQSTHPVRGATGQTTVRNTANNFNPRTP